MVLSTSTQNHWPRVTCQPLEPHKQYQSPLSSPLATSMVLIIICLIGLRSVLLKEQIKIPNFRHVAIRSIVEILQRHLRPSWCLLLYWEVTLCQLHLLFVDIHQITLAFNLAINLITNKPFNLNHHCCSQLPTL